MNAKRIQTLMGHSSITLTYDRYGHWFTRRRRRPKGRRGYSDSVCSETDALQHHCNTVRLTY